MIAVIGTILRVRCSKKHTGANRLIRQWQPFQQMDQYQKCQGGKGEASIDRPEGTVTAPRVLSDRSIDPITLKEVKR